MAAVEVLIGGVQRYPLSGSIIVAQALGQRQTADLTVRVPISPGVTWTSTPSGYRPTVGQDIAVFEVPGANRVFGGLIQGVTTRTLQNTMIEYRLRCMDYSWILDRRLAGQYEWSGLHAGAIVRDIAINSLGSEGITIDTITNNRGPIIDKFKVDFATVRQAYDELLKICGPTWRIWVDFVRALKFEQDPAVATWTVADSSSFVLTDTESYERTTERKANRVWVRFGRYETEEQTESFGGAHPTQPTNGTRKSWALAKDVAKAPTVKVNGAAQTVGIREVDTGRQWYWQQGSKTIEQDAGGTALSSAQTLEVIYVGLETADVFAEDFADIVATGATEGTSGAYEVFVTINDQVARGSAQDIADSILLARKGTGKRYTFETTGFDQSFRPKIGDKLTCNRTGIFGESITGIITNIQIIETGKQETNQQGLRRLVTVDDGPLAELAVKFFSRSSAQPIVGLAQTGAAADPPAENPSAVSAFPIYDKDRWGVQGTVTFGSNRASIARAELIIDGPYNLANNVIAGVTRQQPWAEFVPPVAGNYTYTSEAGGWLRSGSQQRYRVIVRVFNAANEPTASPIASSFFTVDPVNNTTQASSIGASVITEYTADGIEAWKLNVWWTQANDIDASHTLVYVEYQGSGGSYGPKGLYTQTAPGGGDNGFFQSYIGSILEAVPSSSRNIRVTFATVTKDGRERPSAPQVVTSVFPVGGNIQGSRLANSSVTDAKIANLQVSKLTAGTIAVSVTLTAPTIQVSSGSVFVNIDGTSFVRVWNTSLSRMMQLTTTALEAYSTADSNVFARVNSGGFISVGSASGRVVTLDGFGLLWSGDATIFIQSVEVVRARRRGWGLASGVANRGTFDTATVTTQQLAERVKALLDDLDNRMGGHGLIGA